MEYSEKKNLSLKVNWGEISLSYDVMDVYLLYKIMTIKFFNWQFSHFKFLSLILFSFCFHLIHWNLHFITEMKNFPEIFSQV